MTGPAPICREYGDAGLLVEFGEAAYLERWAAARALGEALLDQRPRDLVDVVTGFDTVFVELDPLGAGPEAMVATVERLARVERPAAPGRQLVLPVAYGGRFGPDLERVADLFGSSPDEVVAVHTAEPWTIRFVGSPLGAPLLDGPRLPCSLPRLSSPRVRVEPGSVGMSGHQSIVYNAPSPGGWNLVGRSPLRLFDVEPPHVAHRAGDQLRMVAVDHDSWDDLSGLTLAEYQATVR